MVSNSYPLDAEINKSLDAPDLMEHMTGLGPKTMGGTPERFNALMRAEIIKLGEGGEGIRCARRLTAARAPRSSVQQPAGAWHKRSPS